VVDQGDASTTAGDDDVVQRGILLALRLIRAAMGKVEELKGRPSSVLHVGNEGGGVRDI
jgi:hypothetical protein